MHHTTMESNHPLSEVVSLPALSTGKHNLEEGDQLVILNALDVMHKNQQSILDVFSVDTDVFVLLTAHFSLIPQSTTLIRRGGERIRIQESYMKLGRKRAEALLGWYAFKRFLVRGYAGYALTYVINLELSSPTLHFTLLSHKFFNRFGVLDYAYSLSAKKIEIILIYSGNFLRKIFKKYLFLRNL